MMRRNFFKLFRAVALACMLTVILSILPYAWAETSFRVHYGSREEKRVAVTVDDCYHREEVADIISLCERWNVPVTFFVIGKALKYADQDVWRAALAAGCEIGNHTWSHAYMTSASAAKAKREMTKTQNKLNAVLGFPYTMRLMRPPMGKLGKDAVTGIKMAGYATRCSGT